jgi:hypothetical protein
MWSISVGNFKKIPEKKFAQQVKIRPIYDFSFNCITVAAN